MMSTHRPDWLEKMPDTKTRQASACTRYTGHVLKKAAPERWYISDGSYNLWAEIACLRGGRIAVIGDGPDIIVRCNDWSTSSEGRLRWLAGGGAGYIASKADSAWTWDVDHALNGVWDVVYEWVTDPAYDDWTWERAQDLMESLKHAEEEGDFMERVMDGGIDEPWEYDFGRIVKGDVFMAIAAARCVVEILDQGDENE